MVKKMTFTLHNISFVIVENFSVEVKKVNYSYNSTDNQQNFKMKILNQKNIMQSKLD